MLSHLGLPFVLSPGIEPGALVPQTSILSIKLRERMKKQAEAIASICFLNEALAFEADAEKTVEQVFPAIFQLSQNFVANAKKFYSEQTTLRAHSYKEISPKILPQGNGFVTLKA
jgi:hypothetical protein